MLKKSDWPEILHTRGVSALWQLEGTGARPFCPCQHSCTGAVLALWAGWRWAGCSTGRTSVVSGASLPFLTARSFSWGLAADTHRPECCFGSELRQTFGTKQSALLFVPTDPPCMTKWRKKEGKKKKGKKAAATWIKNPHSQLLPPLPQPCFACLCFQL